MKNTSYTIGVSKTPGPRRVIYASRRILLNRKGLKKFHGEISMGQGRVNVTVHWLRREGSSDPSPVEVTRNFSRKEGLRYLLSLRGSRAEIGFVPAEEDDELPTVIGLGPVSVNYRIVMDSQSSSAVPSEMFLSRVSSFARSTAGWTSFDDVDVTEMVRIDRTKLDPLLEQPSFGWLEVPPGINVDELARSRQKPISLEAFPKVKRKKMKCQKKPGCPCKKCLTELLSHDDGLESLEID